MTISAISARSSRLIGSLFFLLTLFPAMAIAQQSPATLGSIVSSSVSAGKPSSGFYYVTVKAKPADGVKVPDNKCVSRNVWALVRRFVNVNKSASIMLSAKITPISDPSQAITVPIFLTTASEVNETGTGSACQTKFWDRSITFTFNSSLNPSFNVDLTMLVANQLNSTAMATIVKDAGTLMTLVGSASGTPAAIASKLADPAIKEMANRVDTQISMGWTNRTELQISKTLTTVSGGTGYDLITFSLPTMTAGAAGPTVGEWDVGGTIFLDYSFEKFKNGNQWLDKASILAMKIVPQVAPSAPTTLDEIVLSGKVTSGFDKISLITASNGESLSSACSKLKMFLASFLIPDDALVARFALLSESSYQKNPNLRAESGCLSSAEEDKLEAFNPDYFFDAQRRINRDRIIADKLIEDRMKDVRSALLSRNPTLIGNALSKPSEKFYAALGKEATEFFQGDAAISELAKSKMQLVCYRARPNNDLSSIAAVAIYGGKRTGAIVSFGDDKKLASLTLMDPTDVASSLDIDKAAWLDPLKKTCVVDVPPT